MPGEKDDEFDRLETVRYDEDDLPHEEHHTSEVDALELTPLSDKSARELIEDDETD
jgi:hypothetical protein